MSNGQNLIDLLSKMAFKQFKELDNRQDAAIAELLAVSRAAREIHQTLGTVLQDTASIMRLFQLLDGGAAREADWEKIRDRDDETEKHFKEFEDE